MTLSQVLGGYKQFHWIIENQAGWKFCRRFYDVRFLDLQPREKAFQWDPGHGAAAVDCQSHTMHQWDALRCAPAVLGQWELMDLLSL